MSKFSTEEIRDVVRRQNGGLTREEAARKAGIAAIHAVAARLDGTDKAAVSVITGFTPAELDDLGGFEMDQA